MIIFFSLIIILSVVLTVIFIWMSAPKPSIDPQPVRFVTLFFSFWLIASALWGPLFFTYKPPGFFDITIERILFSIILLIMILGLFTGRIDLSFRRSRTIEFYMFLFAVICVISMLRYGFTSPLPESFPNPWFVFITGYFFPFIVFVFAKNYLTHEKDQVLVFQALFLFGTYLVIISFFEFFQMRQFVFPTYINDPELFLHLERARGPFLNAGINGGAIIIGFACGMHLLTRLLGFTRLLYMFLLTLYFPAIFFTQTRAVYLSFLLTLFILLGFYRTTFPKWKLFALPLALTLIFAFIVSPRLLSTERKEGGVMQIGEVVVRFELINRSMEMVMNRPLGGAGLAQFVPASLQAYKGRGTVAESADEVTQHNHLLGLAVELGIFGLLVYLIPIILIFRRLYQMRGRIPETGFMGTNFLILCTIIWISYLNVNMFLEPSFFLFYNAVPFMFGGIADGVYNRYIIT